MVLAKDIVASKKYRTIQIDVRIRFHLQKLFIWSR